ncbi:hypothetical protein ABZY58_11770 [Micromonospora tulbaghiae]|uniref:hypothetical protein n=1 Tax=Micromonospora tulbaghiae TaxID=479978 RepID=UPI0033A39183
MTAPQELFPDVEEILAVLLEPLVGGSEYTGPEVPANLQQLGKFIRVKRGGGYSDQLNDYATVDIDCFHTTYRTGVKPLAEAVRQFLINGSHRHGRAVIDRIRCTSAPTEQAWAPGIRRMYATYEVVSRRYRPS